MKTVVCVTLFPHLSSRFLDVLTYPKPSVIITDPQRSGWSHSLSNSQLLWWTICYEQRSYWRHARSEEAGGISGNGRVSWGEASPFPYDEDDDVTATGHFPHVFKLNFVQHAGNCHLLLCFTAQAARGRLYWGRSLSKQKLMRSSVIMQACD